MLIWACPRDVTAAHENGLTVLELFAWMETDGTDDGACPICPVCGDKMVTAEI